MLARLSERVTFFSIFKLLIYFVILWQQPPSPWMSQRTSLDVNVGECNIEEQNILIL